jgi:ABC-type transport system involved in Fe-S cluster assembly fused permease/ATPase subunit
MSAVQQCDATDHANGSDRYGSGFVSRRSVLQLRSVQVRITLESVQLVSPYELRLCCVIIILKMLYIHAYIIWIKENGPI